MPWVTGGARGSSPRGLGRVSICQTTRSSSRPGVPRCLTELEQPEGGHNGRGTPMSRRLLWLLRSKPLATKSSSFTTSASASRSSVALHGGWSTPACRCARCCPPSGPMCRPPSLRLRPMTLPLSARQHLARPLRNVPDSRRRLRDVHTLPVGQWAWDQHAAALVGCLENLAAQCHHPPTTSTPSATGWINC